MKYNYELEAPYNIIGLMHHADKWDTLVHWRPNEPFHARLKLLGTERGRSAAYYRWQDQADWKVYPMFITDMARLITLGTTFEAGGYVDAEWVVVKRGMNYGITPHAGE